MEIGDMVPKSVVKAAVGALLARTFVSHNPMFVSSKMKGRDSMRPSSPAALGSADSLNVSDRRRFPRSSQCYKVGVRLEPPTIWLEPGEASSIIRGTLINVSLGGALFSIDDYLAPNAQCSVEIYGAAGRVIPNKTLGHVVRTSAGPSGGYLSSVEFVKPLRTIKEPGKL